MLEHAQPENFAVNVGLVRTSLVWSHIGIETLIHWFSERDTSVLAIFMNQDDVRGG